MGGCPPIPRPGSEGTARPSSHRSFGAGRVGTPQTNMGSELHKQTWKGAEHDADTGPKALLLVMMQLSHVVYAFFYQRWDHVCQKCSVTIWCNVFKALFTRFVMALPSVCRLRASVPGTCCAMAKSQPASPEAQIHRAATIAVMLSAWSSHLAPDNSSATAAAESKCSQYFPFVLTRWLAEAPATPVPLLGTSPLLARHHRATRP